MSYAQHKKQKICKHIIKSQVLMDNKTIKLFLYQMVLKNSIEINHRCFILVGRELKNEKLKQSINIKPIVFYT